WPDSGNLIASGPMDLRSNSDTILELGVGSNPTLQNRLIRIPRKRMPEGEVSSLDIQSHATAYVSQESESSCKVYKFLKI
ncbi:hypothetical protein A2U01_0031830, partial [Trifolium medium]|nr:hypothetical protein [Trifolium medium]